MSEESVCVKLKNERDPEEICLSNVQCGNYEALRIVNTIRESEKSSFSTVKALGMVVVHVVKRIIESNIICMGDWGIFCWLMNDGGGVEWIGQWLSITMVAPSAD